MIRSFLLLLVLATLFDTTLQAADWPHLRGPTYDAISTETQLANNWPASGPPIRWTLELGAGYSSFVVVANRAYTLFQSNTAMFVIALDADSGAELWRTQVDWAWQPGGMYPGPYASPTWYRERIYFATPSGKVGCMKAVDGRIVWTIDVRKQFQGQGTEFGFASTPLVDEDRVIVPVGGENASLVALNANDGTTLWAKGHDAASYCPALPITLGGRRFVVGFMRNTIVLHDAVTGERVWRERLSSSYDEHAAWPLFEGQHLVIASPFRVGARAFQLRLNEERVTAKSLWSGRQLSNDVCSSVLVDGHIYGFDLQQTQASTHRPSRGVFKCLNVITGVVTWETDTIGQATPLIADGKLILWNETGTLILARANATEYEELARAKLLTSDTMCWAAPALSGKRLFVRDHRRALCVYLGEPHELDPHRTRTLAPPPTHRFDWTRLIPHEPDYPNDAPTAAEVGRWFAWCVGIMGVSMLLTAVVRRFTSRVSFVRLVSLFAFVAGVGGTTVLGTWANTFVLTWPLSLYIMFRALVAYGVRHDATSPITWREHIVGRAALLGFAVVCYGYYRLCIAVGYAMAWGFLAGCLPAAPFVIIAASTRRRWQRWCAECVGFVVYFWVSGLVPGWKELFSE